jgi:ATP-dependent exoDNAse (exonuclease V) alpha subunit
MLVELCASNYATSNGLVNGVDVTFQDYIENNPKPFIWIDLYNSQIGINAHIKNSHIDEQFPPIDKKWTKLQIGSNPSHIITRIQFPIQLVTTRTIHQTQGLTFDRLAFDPSGVTKHGLTYTAIFQNPF